MSQTKAELIKGLNINASAPATALQIDASGNVNIDSNTLYVDATNNRVGLGTSSPSTRLHVSQTGSSQAGLIETDQSASVINFKSTGQSSGQPQVGCAGSDMILNTNGAERVRIDSSGRVGIGVTAPNQPLTANGYMASWGDNAGLLLYDSTGSTFWGGIEKVGNIVQVGTNQSQPLLFNTGNSERARFDTSGRLLVGTSTSTSAAIAEDARVQVVGNNGGNAGVFSLIRSVTAVNDAVLGQIPFADNVGVFARIDGVCDGTPGTNDYPGRLVFFTTADGASSPTERMRITQAGRLLLGTTTSQVNEMLRVVRDNVTTNAATVDVYNSAATSTTKLANNLIRVSSQGSGAAADIVLTDNVTYNYFFGGNNGGAYVVASSNGVRLSNGGTSWASDSDERVKDIIETIDNGLTKVASLRSVIGKYKSDSDDKRRSFLIAQDVQAVLPEAVYDEQGTLMLAYTDVIPLLVSALKESKERIETLEAKVAALEAA